MITSLPHIPPSTYLRFAGYALRVYSRPPDNNTPFPHSRQSVITIVTPASPHTHSLSVYTRFPSSKAINFIDREESISVLASWGLIGHSLVVHFSINITCETFCKRRIQRAKPTISFRLLCFLVLLRLFATATLTITLAAAAAAAAARRRAPFRCASSNGSLLCVVCASAYESFLLHLLVFCSCSSWLPSHAFCAPSPLASYVPSHAPSPLSRASCVLSPASSYRLSTAVSGARDSKNYKSSKRTISGCSSLETGTSGMETFNGSCC